MTSIAEGFGPRRDTFLRSWTDLWSLPPERRLALLDHVLEFCEARSKAPRDAQIGIVERVNREFRSELSEAPAVLDCLAYLARLREVGQESDSEILKSLESLGFLDEEDRGGSQAFLREFFRRLPNNRADNAMTT